MSLIDEHVYLEDTGNTVDHLVTLILKGPWTGYGSPLFTARALLGWRSYIPRVRVGELSWRSNGNIQFGMFSLVAQQRRATVVQRNTCSFHESPGIQLWKAETAKHLSIVQGFGGIISGSPHPQEE